jgi:hypothetical protein
MALKPSATAGCEILDRRNPSLNRDFVRDSSDLASAAELVEAEMRGLVVAMVLLASRMTGEADAQGGTNCAQMGGQLVCTGPDAITTQPLVTGCWRRRESARKRR